MKLLYVVLVAVLYVGFLFSASEAKGNAAVSKSITIIGLVVSVDTVANTIIVNVNNVDDTLSVDSAATIMNGKNKIALSDIQVDAKVKVTYNMADGKMAATKIVLWVRYMNDTQEFFKRAEESHAVNQIPVQFIGTWVENTTNGLCDKVEINKHQIIWYRKDKDLCYKREDGNYYLSTGKKLEKQIVKMDKIQINDQKDSTLSFTTQNCSKATLGGEDVMNTEDIFVTLTLGSTKSTFTFEYTTAVIMGYLGGPAMGGEKNHTLSFKKVMSK